jgi:hypothetical protein
MRTKISFFIIVTILLLASPSTALATDSAEKAPGAVLCLPGAYLHTVSDCNPLGPSDYLTELARSGISFPIPPLPISKPDFELNYVNYLYGEVRTQNAPVYGSIDDALKAKKKLAISRINSSFSYISYTDEAYIDGKRLYMVAPGSWMTANDVIRITAPTFQGLTISQTPKQAFGWVLTYLSPEPTVRTKRSPGYKVEDYTENYLKNHDIVWIYDVVKVSDIEWYLIGPDEWVPQNVIARIIPNGIPPDGIDTDRWIEINLFEQTLAVYDQSELVFATLIASGLDPFWTRPGLFQIYEKLDTTPMRGAFEADLSDAYYLEDVPWTMYFDKARALHGAYWRANLGFPQSHGCVNLSIGDARWLYDWANIDDWVYVWDPSGKTPTDSDIYTDGGA